MAVHLSLNRETALTGPKIIGTTTADSQTVVTEYTRQFQRVVKFITMLTSNKTGYHHRNTTKAVNLKVAKVARWI